jgi:integration host factor subunit beta
MAGVQISPIPLECGMTTITKKDLVNRIAARTKQTKIVTKDIIQTFLDEIVRELGMGNRLEFREFGVFEIKERAARKAQNPRTLRKVDEPAKRVVKFKVGRAMKVVVDQAPGTFAVDHTDDDDEEPTPPVKRPPPSHPVRKIPSR